MGDPLTRCKFPRGVYRRRTLIAGFKGCALCYPVYELEGAICPTLGFGLLSCGRESWVATSWTADATSWQLQLHPTTHRPISPSTRNVGVSSAPYAKHASSYVLL